MTVSDNHARRSLPSRYLQPYGVPSSDHPARRTRQNSPHVILSGAFSLVCCILNSERSEQCIDFKIGFFLVFLETTFRVRFRVVECVQARRTDFGGTVPISEVASRQIFKSCRDCKMYQLSLNVPLLSSRITDD